MLRTVLGLSIVSVLTSAGWAADWLVLDPIYDGSTRLEGLAYQYSQSGYTTVPVVWEREWGSGTWKLNGISCAYSPFRPFGDVVTSNHTIRADSSGSITLRIQWIGTGPAPAQVAVMVRSTAMAEYSRPSPFGWGTTDCGVEGSAITYQNDDGIEIMTETSLKPETLDVNDGIAQITLTKSAHAEVPGGFGDGRVWAEADQAVIYPKTANVLVDLNGFQAKKKTLPSILSHTIVPFKNPHHDLRVPDPQNAMTVTWNATSRAAVDPLISANSNYAAYIASGTTRWQWDAHFSQPDKHVWSGWAGSHQLHIETYQWTVGSTGDFHCNQCSDYSIPSEERTRWPHSFYPHNGIGYKSASFQHGYINSDAIQLVYCWGHVAHCPVTQDETATRDVQYVLPTSIVATTGQVLSPTIGLIPVWVEEVGNHRVPAGIQYNVVTGFVEPPAFNTQAAITIAGHATDLSGTINNAYAQGVAGIAALVGVSLEMYRESKIPLSGMNKYISQQQYCWWYVNSTVGSEVPPVNWSSTQNYFEWEAFIRPNQELSADAVDRYGMQGYIGRFLVQHAYDGSPHNGTEFRKYFYNSGGSGSSGPGGSGGS